MERLSDQYSTRMREHPQLYPLDAQFGTAPTKQDAAQELCNQPCDSPLHILVEHDRNIKLPDVPLARPH